MSRSAASRAHWPQLQGKSVDLRDERIGRAVRLRKEGRRRIATPRRGENAVRQPVFAAGQQRVVVLLRVSSVERFYDKGAVVSTASPVAIIVASAKP